MSKAIVYVERIKLEERASGRVAIRPCVTFSMGDGLNGIGRVRSGDKRRAARHSHSEGNFSVPGRARVSVPGACALGS